MQSSSLSVSALETTVRCTVAASASLRASAETIAQWRRQPLVVGTEKMPISFLKHAEDQTIVAMKAVLAAHEPNGPQRSFADWGVIAAPNLFGRVNIAQTMQRFQDEGAWGVSPHCIPHQSLHGMSGTISQALKIYGPNFGVSGAPNAGPDAFLIAAAMLADGRLPGLWVVLTGYESEWIPAAEGPPSVAPLCQAVALALTPSERRAAGLHLAIGHVRPDAERAFSLAHLPEFQLGFLAEELTAGVIAPGGRWRLSETTWVELETVLLDREVPI